MRQKENWSKLENFSRYLISDKGRVKCILRRNNAYNNYYKADYIMQQFNYKGYRKIQLTNDSGKRVTMFVHRLVALAFLPQTVGKKFINHKDGNKTNNCVENLEWCTQQENIHHAINTGLLSTKAGHVLPKREKSPPEELHRIQKETLDKYRTRANQQAAKLFSKKINQYDLNENFIKTWDSSKQIERELHFPHSHVNNVCKGKRKTAYGYIWRYHQ